MPDWLYRLDWGILHWVSGLRNPLLDPVMLFFTALGNGGTLWIILSLAMICTKKYRLAGITALLLLCLCSAMNNLILKPLFARPRPYLENMEWIPMRYERSFSFPSGHASGSAVFAFSCLRLFGRRAVPIAVVALIVALSRVYIGVHFPSDVLAGITEGFLMSLPAAAIHQKIKSRLF